MLRQKSQLVLVLLGALLTSIAFAGQTTHRGGQAKIIGGIEASLGQFPYQVALVSDPDDAFQSQYCGGSIVSDRWVVTAAHCFDANDSYVMAGFTDLNNTANAQVALIERWIVYPTYQGATFDSDIAMLELATPLDLEACGSACAPIQITELGDPLGLSTVGNAAFISGWGDTTGLSEFPSDLLYAETNIAECLTEGGYAESEITENMICASTAQFDKDSCQGDSGGPLAVMDDDGNYNLVGITSWGEGCASEPFPGVYTRVANFKGWIDYYAQESCEAPATDEATEIDTVAGRRIQQNYIAFYGRPGDYAGIVFWAGRLEAAGNLEQIQSAFADSDEYRERIIPAGASSIAELSDAQITELINNLYQNMFARDGDEAGLEFWSGQLKSGARDLVDIATAIAEGAQVGGDDYNLLEARVDAAQQITKTIEFNDLPYELVHINDIRAFIFELIDDPNDCPFNLPEKVVIDIVNNTFIPTGEYDESEPNDDFGTADSIVDSVRGYMTGTDLDDFYTFTATASGPFVFNLDGIGGDLDLYLYDSDQTELAAPFLGGSVESIVYVLEAGQTYFVAVNNFAGIGMDYTVEVIDLSTVVTEMESNNQFSSANDIGDFVTGTMDGVDISDYFRFSVASTGTYLIRLDGNGGDLDLTLFDANQDELGTSGQVGSFESLAITLEAGNQYYLAVENFSGTGNFYSLSIENVDNAVSESEPNNSVESANAFNTTVTGTVTIGDLSDFFFFTANDTKQQSIVLSAAGADVDMFLYDSDGNLVTSSETPAFDERIDLQVIDGESYTIEIYNWQANDEGLDLPATYYLKVVDDPFRN